MRFTGIKTVSVASTKTKERERENDKKRKKLINSHKTLIRLNGLLELNVSKRPTFCLIFITFDCSNKMNDTRRKSLQEVNSRRQKLNGKKSFGEALSLPFALRICWKVYVFLFGISLFILNFAPKNESFCGILLHVSFELWFPWIS